MFITADRRCLAAITPTDPRHLFLTSWLHAALQNQMAFLLRAFVAICSVEKNLILNNFSLQLQRKYAQTNNNKQNKTISARKQHPCNMSLVALTKWVLHFLQEQWRHWIQWIAVSRPFGTHNGKSLSSSVSILYRRGETIYRNFRASYSHCGSIVNLLQGQFSRCQGEDSRTISHLFW